MRIRASLASVSLLAATLTVPCARAANAPPTQQTIDELAARASHAQPREQCFLYAQLVSQMTDLSLRQYASGDIDKAMASLHGIQQAAQKIHLSLANDDKRLKTAEILLSQTTFRLTEMLHASSFEDRPLVAQALAQVSHAQDEALLQVLHR